MKRLHLLIPTVLVFGFLISACGGETQAPETIIVTQIVEGEVVEVVITATPAPAEEEIVTLAYWRVEVGQERQDNANRNLIASFEAEYPNIKIDLVEKPWLGFQDALTAAVMGGGAPDVANVQSSWAQAYIPFGTFESVDDIVSAIGKDNYGDAPRIAYTGTDGDWYLVPEMAFPQVVWYRADLFEEKGLTAPTNWEEMLEAAKALTVDLDGDGTIDRYGLVMAMSYVDQDYALMFGTETNDATFLDADGNPSLIEGSYEYDRFVESLAYLKELKTCCMSDGVLTWGQAETRNIWTNDEAAMLVSSTSFVNNIQQDAPEMLSSVSTKPKGVNT